MCECAAVSKFGDLSYAEQLWSPKSLELFVHSSLASKKVKKEKKRCPEGARSPESLKECHQ